MKNKFWFLVKNSLLKKIKNKTFIIVNILLLIVLPALINVDKIITYFGGNFNNVNNIMIVDDTNYFYDIFSEELNSSNTLVKYEIVKEKSYDDSINKIESDEDILIIVNESDDNIIDVKLVTYGYISNDLYELINSSLNSAKKLIAMNMLDIDEEELSKITSDVQIEREYIQENKTTQEEQIEKIMGVVSPIIILPFFMLILLVVQMIGAEINEEKSTRSMEIIISNVSAKVHFFSKILATNIFVIIQSILLFLYSFIGILLRGKESISNIEYVSDITSGIDITSAISSVLNYLPIVLILMLITLIGYSILAGILASMTTNMEDFQQLQTPIMVISLLGFYLAVMSSMFDGSLFIRILSYVPFISAILSPSLLLTGVIGFKDIVLSVLIMIIVIYLLIKYGLRIYKEGILNYSSNGLWSKMLKALKGEDTE